MNWLWLVILAYFLNATAIAVDKFLLTKKIPNPAVYTFFIATLSLLALVIAPFGFHFYDLNSTLWALIAGLIFTFALLYMFKALSRNEASRVTPFMGGLQPIFIFLLAWIFLNEALGPKTILAFLVIIAGTVAISWQKGRADKKSYRWALFATLLFAISYTLNKYVYLEQNFISGFVWTRLGAFLGALFLFFGSFKNRRDIWREIQKPKKQTGLLFLGGQIAGALSFILVNYAIAISPSVALVNALQGLQYVFLLLIIGLTAKKFPALLAEKMTPQILLQKALATITILAGLFLLFW